jgi:hypothetical protein
MGAPASHRTARSVARILSLGFPLPGVRVDNYNVCSAPAFFDYDAIVVDLRALSRFVETVLRGEQQAQTFGGRRVMRHAEQPDDIAIAALLGQRADETTRLLARGGLVVLFAHPPAEHVLAEGAVWRDDAWLGAEAPRTTPADGTEARISDYEHPLAAFVHGQAANIAYRAHVRDADLPPGARVFARSAGGATVGLDYPAGGGRIVVLPALKAVPSGDGRYALSDAFQAGIRRLLGVPGEGRAPQWIASHPVPGLDERAAAVKRAQQASTDAENALIAAEAAHEELARYQRLLWQEGRLGLEDAVLDALRSIGAQVYATDPDNLELRIDGRLVLLEIDASEREVDLAPHYRLRQRLETAIEKRGTAPRGLLIVNGHRHTAPSERGPQASPALRAAAEQMQYAVAPTTLLFAAVVRQLNGEAEAAAAFLTRLVVEVGVLD